MQAVGMIPESKQWQSSFKNAAFQCAGAESVNRFPESLSRVIYSLSAKGKGALHSVASKPFFAGTSL